MMVVMHASQRKRIVEDLAKLAPNEFEALLSEVQDQRHSEEAGIAALAAAFAQRSTPLLAGLFGGSQKEE